VVREYEQNLAETLWICLDLRGKPGEVTEDAVEAAASLSARAFQAGRRFGFSCPGATIEPGQGSGHLERVLHALARVDFNPLNPRPVPPVNPSQCVLVTIHPGSGSNFGDVITLREGSRLPEGARAREALPTDAHPTKGAEVSL
jgi:uncharacterized protein (DUF58 family)